MNACRKTEVDCTYSKVWPYMGISYRLGRLSPTKGCRYSLQKKKLVGPQRRCANLSLKIKTLGLADKPVTISQPITTHAWLHRLLTLNTNPY